VRFLYKFLSSILIDPLSSRGNFPVSYLLYLIVLHSLNNQDYTDGMTYMRLIFLHSFQLFVLNFVVSSVRRSAYSNSNRVLVSINLLLLLLLWLLLLWSLLLLLMRVKQLENALT
jgi:hypothetical protein